MEDAADEGQYPIAPQTEDEQENPPFPHAAPAVVRHGTPENLVVPKPPAHLAFFLEGSRIPGAEDRPEQKRGHKI